MGAPTNNDNVQDVGPTFSLEEVLDPSAFPVYDDSEHHQLCVPQDSLDDIDLYPDFTNDIIFESDLCLSQENPEKFLSFGDRVKPTNMPVTLNKDAERTKLGEGFQLVDDSSTTNFTFGKKSMTKTPSDKARSCNTAGEASFPSATKENREVNRICTGNTGTRRCNHCQSEKTPQWREGPLGPGTLCNACGVRYRSGRLLPEYRPAASPTFNGNEHSNFHKHVLLRGRLKHAGYVELGSPRR
ncbi:GATA transcription factor 4 [Morella rubra]|uniref:GATA transcription factor 4 n=1 Tax=Morella rubra TaxID=262757 RepID=A0A6A1VCE7_9ROSI|nr:GATA transcription factor 4 [Morella rubra]